METLNAKVKLFIYPNIGTPSTNYAFGMNSLIIENDKNLNDGPYFYRLDFERDGIFDTEWTDIFSEKLFYKNYSEIGKHWINIKIKNVDGHTGLDSVWVYTTDLFRLADRPENMTMENIDWNKSVSSQIAFVSRSTFRFGCIFTYDVITKEIKQITNEKNHDDGLGNQVYAYDFPQWSNDGSLLSFRGNAKDSNAITALNLNTGIEKISHRSDSFNIEFSVFSPDDKFILDYNGKVWDLVNDSVYTYFPNLSGYPAWDRKSNSLYILSKNYILNKIDFSTKEVIETEKFHVPTIIGASISNIELVNKILLIGYGNQYFGIYSLETKTFLTVRPDGLDQSNNNGGLKMWWPSFNQDATLIAFEGQDQSDIRKTIWAIKFPSDF